MKITPLVAGRSSLGERLESKPTFSCPGGTPGVLFIDSPEWRFIPAWDYAYSIAAIGAALHFFGRRRQLKHAGQVVLGFGILFIGFNTISHVLKPLGGSALFRSWIAGLDRHRYLGVLVGMAMTMIVQSNGATIGVLQSVASRPVAAAGTVRALIPLPAAVPILLGDNIGTTITALLAGIGANRAAKRATVSHSLFNVFGTILCLLAFPLFISLVYLVSPTPIPAPPRRR